MNRITCLAVGIASIAILSGAAQAQSLADVEHARASHRVGAVNEHQANLIRQWGASTSSYTNSRLSADRQPTQNQYDQQRNYRTRR